MKANLYTSPVPSNQHRARAHARNANKKQCLVIGRDAKNVSPDEALSYIGAYTVGNDISSRKLQRDAALAGRVPQWGFSKGFDTYAPLGPCLVAGSEIADPSQLLLKTVVDGELRQEESISDLLFDCAYLVSYLSSGTTLQKGSVIMTGTPGGKYIRNFPIFGYGHYDLWVIYIGFADWIVFRCWGWAEPAAISCAWDTDGCVDLRNWNAEE